MFFTPSQTSSFFFQYLFKVIYYFKIQVFYNFTMEEAMLYAGMLGLKYKLICLCYATLGLKLLFSVLDYL